jgi:phage tail-like protein
VAEKSSYLQYLPPVLWADEPADPALSLGGLLRIFEKVLTGIADDVPVVHRVSAQEQHEHAPLTAEIARLSRLFDPWQAPEPFLPWLATWVALDFPTLQGKPLWDEYQRRKVTSEIARIYRLRGLKSGLNQYLDLYSVGETRPRVALDDGSRLLVTTPGGGRPAPVAALVTQGPQLGAGNEVLADGMFRPGCLALGSDGSVFVGDTGAPFNGHFSAHRVWRVDASGRYDLDGAPPSPKPIAATSLRPGAEVAAVAVAPARSGRPQTLYVLDLSGKIFAVPNPAPDATATPLALAAGAAPTTPVAMCVDLNGDLLVLDRGHGPGTARPPAVISIRPDPLAATRHPLQQVLEPLSMLVIRDGTIVIGDGREQAPDGRTQLVGNLVHVDRADPAHWAEKVVLPADPTVNSLLAPTAVAPGADDSYVYVLDAGLKPVGPQGTDPFVLAVAEPAAVYRVDLLADQPSATRVTELGQFVYPKGMVARAGRLIICDPGQPDVPGMPTSLSRALPFRFDVVVHFTESRLPKDPIERTTLRRRAVGNILTIVDEQKPAHTHRVLVTET